MPREFVTPITKSRPMNSPRLRWISSRVTSERRRDAQDSCCPATRRAPNIRSLAMAVVSFSLAEWSASSFSTTSSQIWSIVEIRSCSLIGGTDISSRRSCSREIFLRVLPFATVDMAFCIIGDCRACAKNVLRMASFAAIRAVPCVRFASGSVSGTKLIVPILPRSEKITSPGRTTDHLYFLAISGEVRESASTLIRPPTLVLLM